MYNLPSTRFREPQENHCYTLSRFSAAKLTCRAIELIVSLAIIGEVLLFTGTANAGPLQQSQQSQATQDQDEGSRQIMLEEFTRARPSGAQKSTSSAVRRRPPTTGVVKPPRYRRKGPPLLAALKIPSVSMAELGVTIWRLRPSEAADRGARVLSMESGQASQLTPERIEANQLLSLGERVRISIESPRAGYLYVVDREQYSDGTFGEPMLIFPTTRTRGGDNRVRPGVLIDVPAQEDSPPYFTLKSDHRAYAGELLMVIVVPQPIENLPIGPQPLALPLAEVLKWQKLLSTQAELFEMVGGVGKPWTQAEQVAALTRGARTLTQDEPGPQTIYRVALRAANGFMVNVPLRCTR